MAKERWYYAGQRVSDKKLLNAWMPEGAESYLMYKKVFGVIGALYEVDVTRTDGKITVKFPFVLMDKEPRHDNTSDWVAMETAQRTRLNQMQREAKLEKEGRDLGDFTLAQISRQYRGLVGSHQPAFLAQVLSRIMRG